MTAPSSPESPAPSSPPFPPRPTLVVLGGVFVGMTWASALGLDDWSRVVVCAVVAGVLALAGRRSAHATAAAMVVASVALGLSLQIPMERERVASREALAALAAEPTALVEIQGYLADEAWVGRRSVMALLRPGAVLGVAGQRHILPGAMMVRTAMPDEASRRPWMDATAGDEVRGVGLLEPMPDAPDPGEFDAWIDSQGARGLVMLRLAEVGPPADGRGPWGTLRAAIKARTNTIEGLFARTCDPERAALMTALTLGRTGGLSAEQRAAFRATGLAHLYSVSGLHTATVGLVLMMLGGVMGLGPRWRAVLVIGGLFLFCAMTGFRTPCLRAALIVAVFTLQALAYRSTDSLAGLASVALVLVIARPAAVWQLDFQLSFLCALVLLLSGGVTLWIEKRLGDLFDWTILGAAAINAAKIIAVSVLIQLVLAPMLLRHFGEVSLIAPIANLVGIPLSGIAMVMGLAAAAVEYLSPAASELIAGLAGGVAWLLDVAMQWLAAMAVVSVRVATPWPAWVVAACYALMAGGGWLARAPRPWIAAGVESFARSLLVVAAMIVAWSWWGPRPPLLTVTFFDVGQGDATLLQTRDGHTLLVDTGPPGQGRAVADHLRRRGIDRLDQLLLTHADADHVGGAATIVRQVTPGVVFVGGSLASTDAWRDLALAVEARAVPVRQLARGDRFSLGDDVEIGVLHPTPSFLEPGDDRNDASIVLRVRCGEVVFLLTGDAEAEAEADMLASLPAEALRADVLKAGHHGSRSSTTAPLLAAVRPTHAVISAGRNNRYGHPAPEALARLAEWQPTVWRTDHQGTITMTTNGNSIDVRVERGAVSTQRGRPTATTAAP